MIKKFILSFLCFALIPIGSKAQFVDLECPDVVECFDSNTSITLDMTISVADAVDIPCLQGENLGARNNLRFEALSTDFHIFYSSSGPGFDGSTYMSISEPCEQGGECLYTDGCWLSPELEITDLIVGHEYILSVFACGIDIEVVIEIEIGELDLPEEPIDIVVRPSQICVDQEVFCTSTSYALDLIYDDSQSQEYFNSKKGQWHISANGPENLAFDFDVPSDFEFSVSEPGNYLVCLDSATFNCTEIVPSNLCTEIEVVDIPTEEYGILNVCQHDLEIGNWVPDNNWQGGFINEEGSYDVEYEADCGCLVGQTVSVEIIPEIQSEVVIELCPDDYPFVFLDYDEFDYSPFDEEFNLYIDEGSIIFDYDNDPCDSLVYLILINEDPEERCSSCKLPLSLRKSKIVLCLPFDNSTVDVSGKNTIVHETGIDYDDNGSTTNDLWEAVFDGDEDYVTIPHIDDLNTSVFSINFQFNKDEPFENGNIETLISKGDLDQGNLRYDVSLEKGSESIFDLRGVFYTATGQVDVVLPNLETFSWYDIAYVVETDSISLYLDGNIYSRTVISENLRGNTEDFYIGTLINNNTRIQFYNGRLDNFKYWKQKLSGQDVLFLHLPEKEFEVEQSYFLSCCAQVEFRDVLIDINNPLDSVIVPNASPTGYDSVYILNYIQADPSPELNMAEAPQDMVFQYQQICQEFCETAVSWELDFSDLFTDNCGIVTVSQSHDFDVVLNENISFVEITLTGTDNCGQSVSHNFNIELECLPSNVTAVPEENVFEILVDDVCINEEDEICIFSDLQLQLGFLEQMTGTIQPYDNSSEFSVVLNVNGITQTLNTSDVLNGFALNGFANAGIYEICLESVGNTCETIANNYCQTIIVRESNIIDYGEVFACRDDIESALPSELSLGLRNLILSNPQETSISLTEKDECGCEKTEKLSLVINENVEEYLMIELCEGDIYDGRTENGIFTIQFIAANGCDSLVHVDLKFLPNSEEEIVAEICEGNSFEGYTEAGTYLEEHSNIYGCDSMLTIQLSFLPKSYDDLFVEICPDSMYLGYNQTGIYEMIDTNVFGCDSITTLNLTVLDEMHPDCFVSSLDEIHINKISVFPNPVGQYLTVKSEVDIRDFIGYEIIDIRGRVLLSGINLGSQIDVSEIANGLFVIKLTQNDNTDSVIKFVKL